MSWTHAPKKEWVCQECGEIERAYSEAILASLVELHKTAHTLRTGRVFAAPQDTLCLSTSDLKMFKEMGICP
jgi:hypothetical protein